MRFPTLLLACLLSCDAKTQPVPTPPKATAEPPERVIDLQPVEIDVKLAPRHVMIVGDSEACAVGHYAHDVVTQINLASHEPLDTVDVVCKVGSRVQYWGTEGRFHLALDSQPDLDDVVVFLGTNHYGSRMTPDVEPILSEVTTRDLGCVWVGNTAVHGKAWPINRLIHVAVVPTCNYFDTEAASVPLADGVHPTRAGAIQWLRDVWPLIPKKYEEAS